MQLVGLPMALEWQVEPLDWSVAPGGSLRIVAGPRTDLFADPAGGPTALGAPRILGLVEGDFQLSARVRADLRATFDAGALVLHAADDTWAKLALERSPQGEAMIVSVVTRGLSDDANGRVVTGDGLWLRVARMGCACALHASGDGERWEFVRHFALDAPDGLAAGFLAQSPTGDGCTATFDDVRFVAEPLAELRDGS
jgi:regulation of enolase protein 1 (concanavalin A-like superfamily)